jgi:hypothetical protein
MPSALCLPFRTFMQYDIVKLLKSRFEPKPPSPTLWGEKRKNWFCFSSPLSTNELASAVGRGEQLQNKIALQVAKHRDIG